MPEAPMLLLNRPAKTLPTTSRTPVVSAAVPTMEISAAPGGAGWAVSSCRSVLVADVGMERGTIPVKVECSTSYVTLASIKIGVNSESPIFEKSVYEARNVQQYDVI